jgi:hypothetical protein
LFLQDSSFLLSLPFLLHALRTPLFVLRIILRDSDGNSSVSPRGVVNGRDIRVTANADQISTGTKRDNKGMKGGRQGEGRSEGKLTL